MRVRNPELAADELAQAAMERAILDFQTQDLRKLGFDPTRRQDGSPTAPGEIAIIHRNLRAERRSLLAFSAREDSGNG